VAPATVDPSVIFLNDTVTVTYVDDVIAALNFACMAANWESHYCNSLVFERYIQPLALQNVLAPVSR